MYHPVTRHRRLYVGTTLLAALYTQKHTYEYRIYDNGESHTEVNTEPSCHQIDLPRRCDIRYHLRINIAINKTDFWAPCATGYNESHQLISSLQSDLQHHSKKFLSSHMARFPTIFISFVIMVSKICICIIKFLNH